MLPFDNNAVTPLVFADKPAEDSDSTERAEEGGKRKSAERKCSPLNLSGLTVQELQVGLLLSSGTVGLLLYSGRSAAIFRRPAALFR